MEKHLQHISVLSSTRCLWAEVEQAEKRFVSKKKNTLFVCVCTKPDKKQDESTRGLTGTAGGWETGQSQELSNMLPVFVLPPEQVCCARFDLFTSVSPNSSCYVRLSTNVLSICTSQYFYCSDYKHRLATEHLFNLRKT